ncbi:MAG TPA: hypothetical protein VFP51_07390 [Nocardioidaceae bacterium]|nr:hypothetical protein [Nocardioidaceae bacterium]
MSRRSVFLAVLAWVAVVAVASGVTWGVINAAGQQVLTGGDLPAEAQSGAPTPRTAPTPTRVPQPTPRSTAPAPVPSQQRTWEGSAGAVTVRCEGGRASLQWASPDDGYRVEVGSRGPEEVEVTFKGGAREVKVKGTCVGGSPRFVTESRGGSGGGDD